METDDIFRSGKLTPTISPNYILEIDSDLVTGKMPLERKIGGGVDEEIKLSPLEDRGLAVWGKVVMTGSPEVLVVAGLQQQRKNNSPQPGCSGDDDRISDEHISLENEIKEATAMLETKNLLNKVNLFEKINLA
jgi:hypothetical protein